MTGPTLPSPQSALVEGAGRHWRRLTAGAVVLLAVIGWGWLALAVAGGGMARDMGPGMAQIAPLLDRLAAIFPGLAEAGGGHGALMPAMTAWGARDLGLVLLMWLAMVFAMMVPTAAATFRHYAAAGSAGLAVMAGYIAIWMAVSVAATAGQALLVAGGALAPHMAPAGMALSASVLIAAGLYQFTPLKLSCLLRCRNPWPTLMDGLSGRAAVRVGMEEGLACLGCCWAMMTVMFAAGLMNLPAMALFGALMAAEKLTSGLWFTRLLGLAFLLAGIVLAAGLAVR